MRKREIVKFRESDAAVAQSVADVPRRCGNAGTPGRCRGGVSRLDHQSSIVRGGGGGGGGGSWNDTMGMSATAHFRGFAVVPCLMMSDLKQMGHRPTTTHVCLRTGAGIFGLMGKSSL